jgi:hypothetical protein
MDRDNTSKFYFHCVDLFEAVALHPTWYLEFVFHVIGLLNPEIPDLGRSRTCLEETMVSKYHVPDPFCEFGKMALEFYLSG